MGVFIPSGYGQATFGFRTGQNATKTSAFTLGYKLPAAGATALSHALAIRSAWSSASGRLWWPASYSSQTTFLGVRVTESISGGLITADGAFAVIGTGAQDQMPPNVALLVKKVTQFGGRHNQGRMYLPPAWLSETVVTSAGNLAGGDVITINGMLEASRAAQVAAGFDLYLLHSTAGPIPVPIDSLSIDSRVATQRRRLR